MSEIQTISVAVAATSVVAFVINSIITSRKTEKTQELALKAQEQTLETRQVQLFMQIYRDYNDQFAKAYYTIISWKWSDFNDFMDKYGEIKNPEVWTANGAKIAGYFEGIGVLTRRKMLDPSLVDDLMGSEIVHIWEKMEAVMKQYRVIYSIPDKWENIEYLYNVIKPIYKQQHPELKV